jgi:transposase-like protein
VKERQVHEMKRRQFSSAFKARLALEALSGDKTLNEVAADNDLNPNRLTNWRQEFLEKAHTVFDGSSSSSSSSSHIFSRPANPAVSGPRRAISAKTEHQCASFSFFNWQTRV